MSSFGEHHVLRQQQFTVGTMCTDCGTPFDTDGKSSRNRYNQTGSAAVSTLSRSATTINHAIRRSNISSKGVDNDTSWVDGSAEYCSTTNERGRKAPATGYTSFAAAVEPSASVAVAKSRSRSLDDRHRVRNNASSDWETAMAGETISQSTAAVSVERVSHVIEKQTDSSLPTWDGVSVWVPNTGAKIAERRVSAARNRLRHRLNATSTGSTVISADSNPRKTKTNGNASNEGNQRRSKSASIGRKSAAVVRQLIHQFNRHRALLQAATGIKSDSASGKRPQDEAPEPEVIFTSYDCRTLPGTDCGEDHADTTNWCSSTLSRKDVSFNNGTGNRIDRQHGATVRRSLVALQQKVASVCPAPTPTTAANDDRIPVASVKNTCVTSGCGDVRNHQQTFHCTADDAADNGDDFRSNCYRHQSELRMPSSPGRSSTLPHRRIVSSHNDCAESTVTKGQDRQEPSSVNVSDKSTLYATPRHTCRRQINNDEHLKTPPHFSSTAVISESNERCSAMPPLLQSSAYTDVSQVAVRGAIGDQTAKQRCRSVIDLTESLRCQQQHLKACTANEKTCCTANSGNSKSLVHACSPEEILNWKVALMTSQCTEKNSCPYHYGLANFDNTADHDAKTTDDCSELCATAATTSNSEAFTANDVTSDHFERAILKCRRDADAYSRRTMSAFSFEDNFELALERGRNSPSSMENIDNDDVNLEDVAIDDVDFTKRYDVTRQSDSHQFVGDNTNATNSRLPPTGPVQASTARTGKPVRQTEHNSPFRVGLTDRGEAAGTNGSGTSKFLPSIAAASRHQQHVKTSNGNCSNSLPVVVTVHRSISGSFPDTKEDGFKVFRSQNNDSKTADHGTMKYSGTHMPPTSSTVKLPVDSGQVANTCCGHLSSRQTDENGQRNGCAVHDDGRLAHHIPYRSCCRDRVSQDDRVNLTRVTTTTASKPGVGKTAACVDNVGRKQIDPSLFSTSRDSRATAHCSHDAHSRDEDTSTIGDRLKWDVSVSECDDDGDDDDGRFAFDQHLLTITNNFIDSLADSVQHQRCVPVSSASPEQKIDGGAGVVSSSSLSSFNSELGDARENFLQSVRQLVDDVIRQRTARTRARCRQMEHLAASVGFDVRSSRGSSSTHVKKFVMSCATSNKRSVAVSNSRPADETRHFTPDVGMRRLPHDEEINVFVLLDGVKIDGLHVSAPSEDGELDDPHVDIRQDHEGLQAAFERALELYRPDVECQCDVNSNTDNFVDWRNDRSCVGNQPLQQPNARCTDACSIKVSSADDELLMLPPPPSDWTDGLNHSESSSVNGPVVAR